VSLKFQQAKHLVYGFVGLGLMGGSFAKAIRQNILNACDATGDIIACDKQYSTLQQSKADGIISKGYLPENVKEMLDCCHVVFVCLYPHATLQFIQENKDYFKENSLITDISGVKSEIASALPFCLREDVDFILGHPMAGSEKEGYSNSTDSVFNKRNYILMPHEKNKAENLVFFKNLITAIGFKRIIETDAILHDHKIAFTSQLCHVLAATLVDSAEDTEITAFGGGSFEDLTRIAMINAPLWTELFLANKKELLYHIDSFENSLTVFRELLKKENKDGICSFLELVREKRIAMSRVES